MSKNSKMKGKAAVAKTVTERHRNERKQAAEKHISYKEWKHNRRKKDRKEVQETRA